MPSRFLEVTQPCEAVQFLEPAVPCSGRIPVRRPQPVVEDECLVRQFPVPLADGMAPPGISRPRIVETLQETVRYLARQEEAVEPAGEEGRTKAFQRIGQETRFTGLMYHR